MFLAIWRKDKAEKKHQGQIVHAYLRNGILMPFFLCALLLTFCLPQLGMRHLSVKNGYDAQLILPKNANQFLANRILASYIPLCGNHGSAPIQEDNAACCYGMNCGASVGLPTPDFAFLAPLTVMRQIAAALVLVPIAHGRKIFAHQPRAPPTA